MLNNISDMEIFAEGIKLVNDFYFHPAYISASSTTENNSVFPILGIIIMGILGGIAVGLWYYYWKKLRQNRQLKEHSSPNR